MMHRIILKGADDCVFTMLSMIYDDIVNKIEKAKYTMEEGLETKDREEAVQALDKLLNTKVKEEGGKLIVANDGSPLRNYIGKNKPLLNTLLFRREYTDRPQDKAFGPQKETKQLPSVDVQKLQFLIDNNINSLKDFKDKLKEMDYNSKFKVEREKQKADGTTETIMVLNPKFVTTQKIKVPAVSEEMEKKNKQIASATKRIQKLLQTEIVNSQKQVEEFNKDKSLQNYQNLSDTAKRKVLSDAKAKRALIYKKIDNEFKKEKKRIEDLLRNENISQEEKSQLTNLFKAVAFYEKYIINSRSDQYEALEALLDDKEEELKSKVKQQKDKLDKLKKDLDELSKDKDGNVLMEETEVEVYSPEFYEQTKKFAQDTKLFEMFLDKEGKPIKGLSKIIKDAPKRIKEMQSAQEDIDSKATDSLSLFLNSPALKGKGSPVVRRGRETNYDILIYDLRKVLVLLLNAFGPEYKRQVNTMMEKIKDSLSNEMERLKDIKISDETARAVQQEGKLTDEMDSFYTELSKILRELNSERTVANFFKQKPFSKQRLIRMIMEDKDYLKYRIPKGKESDKLILLKDKMAEPSQIGDIKERLNKKNISKIITILIKNKISPSELFTVKDKATVKSKFKKYTDDLSDVVERVENMTSNIKVSLESQIDEAKEIIVIQEQIGKEDFTDLKQDLQLIDDKVSAIKLKELETLANRLRERLSKPIEGTSKQPVEEKDAEEYIKMQEMSSKALVEYAKNLRNLIEESEKQYKKLSEEYAKLEETRFEDPQKYSARKEELKNFKTNQTKLRKDIVGFKRELYNVEAKLENLIRIVTVLRQKPLFEKFNEAFMSRDKNDIKRLENAVDRVKRILRAKEAPKGAEAKRNLRRGK